MAKIIGYLRVSTPDQKPDRQIDGMEHVCDELRIEHGVSATAKSRPVFEALVKDLKSGDTLAVWDLDRAFRSTIDAVSTAEALRKRGIALRIVTMNLDTSTEDGELVYTIMAGLAQFERRRLSRRTKEGMEAARKRGAAIGRPNKLGKAEVEWAQHILQVDPKQNRSHLAHALGCSDKTLNRALALAA